MMAKDPTLHRRPIDHFAINTLDPMLPEEVQSAMSRFVDSFTIVSPVQSVFQLNIN